MKFPSYPQNLPVEMPPRLNMDDYVAFVTESMKHADPVKVARQKEIEERITAPFRIIPDRKNV